MGPDKLIEIIYRNWAVVMTAPVPFAAALILGCAVGWLAAWLILKQRLQHHRELIDHYKDVIADKAPNTLAATAKKGRNAAMGLGVTFFVLGLIALGLGSAIIYNISVASAPPQIPKSAPEKTSRKAQLQKFYLEGGELLQKPITKETSDADFKNYEGSNSFGDHGVCGLFVGPPERAGKLPARCAHECAARPDEAGGHNNPGSAGTCATPRTKFDC